jgi:hypothetical protein
MQNNSVHESSGGFRNTQGMKQQGTIYVELFDDGRPESVAVSGLPKLTAR